MLYRIRIDLAFHEIDALQDIIDKALDHLDEAITLNQGQPNEEKGHILLEHCHHDERGNEPCQLVEAHYTS